MSSWAHVGEDVCHRDRLGPDPRPRRFGSLWSPLIPLISSRTFSRSMFYLFYYIYSKTGRCRGVMGHVRGREATRGEERVGGKAR